MSDSEPSQRAYDAALRLLAYRPRSESEVRTRLGRRFPSDEVDRVIDALKARGLVDDDAFSRLWSDSRNSRSPRSAAAITRELVSKGVSGETARQASAEIDDEDSAYRAGLRMARRYSEADHSSFKRKLWGRLKRRGFTDSVTRRAISRLWSDRNQAGDW